MATLTMEAGARVPKPIRDVAYRAQHLGMLLPTLAAMRLLRLLARRGVDIERDAQLEVQRRYEALLRQDLQNVEQKLYPKSLLFQFPFVDYLKAAPALAADIPRSIWRMWRKNHRDLPDEIDLSAYPPYFRRNFHWQTDGYFSRRSAAIYDVGVELLFLGTADVMRRMLIPPVTRFAREHGSDLRLLDVACGTGRMLHQLAIAHPKMRFFGIDLSPYYVQHARELLTNVEHLSLVADNAEAMPFRDGYFDVITSVHLFHELPPEARRNVYADMWRVLRPGGLLVIEDSAQRSESSELAFFLSRFSNDFHEPYHAGYVEDDIGACLEQQGFVDVKTERHFVSKVVIARKPA